MRNVIPNKLFLTLIFYTECVNFLMYQVGYLAIDFFTDKNISYSS